MPLDAFTQLAPDSTGKKVDMDQVATAAGDTLYREKAILVGETGDALQLIAEEMQTHTKILTEIYKVLISSNPEFSGVDLLDKDRWSV
jgi:rRNA processing protein Krr1/Pno1